MLRKYRFQCSSFTKECRFHESHKRKIYGKYKWLDISRNITAD